MAGIPNSQAVIEERRQKVWTCVTRGMKSYEIATELNVDKSTITRDIKYLSGQSQNYLNDLARSTVPYMYQKSIDGIAEILKKCWEIYESTDDRSISWIHKLAALKLAKECNESQFKLLSDSPSVMYLKALEDKLIQIENNGQRV
jgi:transcriptional antiterminator